jgi:hypothetical protein
MFLPLKPAYADDFSVKLRVDAVDFFDVRTFLRHLLHALLHLPVVGKHHRSHGKAKSEARTMRSSSSSIFIPFSGGIKATSFCSIIVSPV